jgi:RHS repeat-associated protein
VPAGLVGGTYTIYAMIADGGVSAGSYASGSLTVDAANTDRLLSAPVTADASYTLRYGYNGAEYTGTYVLSMGDNALYNTIGAVTHEYHITRVPTLTDSDHTAYDELGAVTAVADSAGQAVSYTYDQLKRLTQVTHPDGSTVDYTYDVAGNLLTMHDATGWQLYTYDALDRLTSVTYSADNHAGDAGDLTIGYEYDLASRLTALVYPSGKRVEYGYDNAGKLTTVTEKNASQPNLVTTYVYSATTGLLMTETRPNDTRTQYTYDTSGRLTTIRHERTSTSALILQYAYTLDADGRRTQVIVTTPTATRGEKYEYDAFNRLAKVTYSDNNGTFESTDKTVVYTYDGNGNRLSMTTDDDGSGPTPATVLNYAYGPENRLEHVTDGSGSPVADYYYDWRGNQVMKVTPTQTTRYTFDDRNLLTAVDDGTSHIEYAYDGAGRRISQAVNGIFTQFVVEPSNPIYQTIEERNAAGTVSANYTYGLDRIAGVLPGGSVPTYYLPDALSSVGALTDPAGASLGIYKYDAFGQVLAGPTYFSGQYSFGGERLDTPTTLVHLRARMYDPSSGRLLSGDPLGMVAGLNLYQYCDSDPVNGVDPSGTYKDDDSGDYGEIITPYTYRLRQLFPDVPYGPVPSPPIVDNLLNNITVPPYFGGNARGEGVAVGSPEWTAADYAQKFAIFHDKYQALNDAQGFTLQDVWRGAQAATTSWSAFSDFASTLSAFALNAAGAVGTAALDFGKGVIGGIGEWLNSAAGGISGLGFDGISYGDIAQLTGSNRSYGFMPPPPGGGGSAGLIGLDPGGVLIDQAATLVDGNLRDITGATYDPVSHQLVFLGSASAAMHDVSLGYFTTAVQAVYGSSVPPYVTLDPPAKLLNSSFDLGSGAGVVPNGKTASIGVHYTPYTWTEADDMTLSFTIDGNPATVRLDGYPQNIYSGDRRGMWLTMPSSTGLPSGFTVTMPPKYSMSQAVFVLTEQGQDSYWTVSLVNNTGASVTITNLQLIPDLQQRKFSGRVDNTELGWIMFEADRITKDLALGKDQLTSAIYDSHNPSLPSGFQNMLERYLAAGVTGQQSTRLWLTPNQETLKRYIDPATGEATVVFDQSSVLLKTESLLTGHPEDQYARAFVDFFNSHYDDFANMEFAVHDPSDPTGNSIIYVKVFEKLRDAMKAVSLARFFHDNNIPLDTWWLNGYTPPTVYIPKAIPTLTNSASNGSLVIQMWGGVQIDKPNTYVPDAVAQVVTEAVKSQRTDLPGDLDAQSWNVSSTPVGNLNAVAASFDATRQDANITLSAADLAFDIPGDLSLAFDRYYNSGYVGKTQMGQVS